MSSLSPELTQWLENILSEGTDSSDLFDSEEFDDADLTEATFDGHGLRLIWYFPDDNIQQEYLAAVSERPEQETRKVIRRMLIPSGATGSDHIVFEAYLSLRDREYGSDDEKRWSLEWMSSDYVQRVVQYLGGKINNPPWGNVS